MEFQTYRFRGHSMSDPAKYRTKELQQAKEQLQAHQTATTSLGRSVAMARIEQEAATESLQAYRTELAGQTGRATDEQRVKLKTLREQVSQADRNLKELTNALQEFDSLPAFLEHVALLTDTADKAGSDMVSVMTLHAAKGLEFDTVFLPGWEEGLFPNQRALDDKGAAGLEEERRLAYVGLTRARRRAYVSFAANRRVFNQWQAAIPSRFLKELPTAQLAESSDAGLYATYSAGHHGGLRDQASGFDYESLGVTGMGRARTRWRDETLDDRRAVEGDKPDLGIGQRVFHQKFGYGRIVAVDGNKLDIDFEKAGPKKVLDSFIEAA